MEKAANHMKVGFLKRFPDETDTRNSPYMPDNREFCCFSKNFKTVNLLFLFISVNNLRCPELH
jgi:hypothetical protein